MNTLDKSSYVPMSKQIYDIICSRIIEGDYKVGTLLPSQGAFSKEFGVSMITVRQAFRELSAKGIINSHRGKGSYVSGIPATYDSFHSARGFTVDSKFSRYFLETIVLEIENSYKSDEAKKYFNIKNEYPIFINRVRILNGIKASLEYSFLNPVILPATDWKNEIINNLSLYEFIKNKYGYKIDRAEEKIYPVIPSKEIKELLSLNEKVPILFIKRLAYIEGYDSPFEYCEYYILPEYYGSVLYSSS